MLLATLHNEFALWYEFTKGTVDNMYVFFGQQIASFFFFWPLGTKGLFGLSLLLLKLKVAEIENWKYCSKIIFKYVNSTVEPIFNEKVAEKWYLWVCEQ